MGSGRKRKENDQPIIKRPKSPIFDISIGKPEQAANLCPISFQIELINKSFAVKGAKLELISNGQQYNFYLAGVNLGTMNQKHSNIITKCSEIGIKYKGEVIEDKGRYYARFVRIA